MRSRLGASSLAVAHETLGARHVSLWRKSGIFRMEVCGCESITHYDHRDQDQISELSHASREQGVEICAVHAPAGLLLSSSCEETRRKAVRQAAAAMDAAVEMGASLFVCHLGATKASEASARDLLETAVHASLQIGVENDVGTELHDYVELADRIGSDRFGVVVDIGHLRRADGSNPFTEEETAYDSMALCGSRLVHVHLHDYNRTGPKMDHWPPFMGDIKWGEVFRALKDIEYDGVIMFEPSWVHPNVLDSIAGFPARFAGHGWR